MGRGRAKAKQTKVARELKYRPMDTDFSSLARELRGDSGDNQVPDAYADLVDEYGVDKRAGDEDDTSADDSEGYDDLRKSG